MRRLGVAGVNPDRQSPPLDAQPGWSWRRALPSLDDALTLIESHLTGLLSLQPTQRHDLTRMGDKSEAFCRQTLTVLAQNAEIVPASLDLAGAQAGLVALDALRPRVQRLQQVLERGQDTEMALGSDIIGVALEGYGLLKLSGRNQGLDGLRRELSAYFAKAPRAPKAETVVASVVE